MLLIYMTTCITLYVVIQTLNLLNNFYAGNLNKNMNVSNNFQQFCTEYNFLRRIPYEFYSCWYNQINPNVLELIVHEKKIKEYN